MKSVSLHNRICSRMRLSLVLGFMALLVSAYPTTGNDTQPDAHTQKTHTSDLRDPFWPVGWRPPSPGERPDPLAGLEIEWPDLPVRGRSLGVDGKYRALIPGIGIVGAGETVVIQHQGLWFAWKITDIDVRGVRSIRLGAAQDRAEALQLSPPESPEENEL